jgi:hypothetical protein
VGPRRQLLRETLALSEAGVKSEFLKRSLWLKVRARKQQGDLLEATVVVQGEK